MTAKQTAPADSLQTGFITSLVQLARIRDWYKSKLPFSIAAAMLLWPSIGTIELLAIGFGICAWAGFGFALNEIEDLPSDLRAGKKNRAAGLSRASRAFILGFTALTSLSVSLVWAVDIWAPLSVLAGLALAWAYSSPPLRLKERGLGGVLAGAAAQWSLPVLAIATAQPSVWTRGEVWALALSGLFLGIRWMCIHQLEDEFRDRVSGVRTFVNLGGSAEKLTMLAFVAELFFLALALYLAWPNSKLAYFTLLFWLISGIGLLKINSNFRRRLLSYHDAPLAGFYFLALPLALLAGRVAGVNHFEPTSWVYALVIVGITRTLVYQMRRRAHVLSSIAQQSALPPFPGTMARNSLKEARESALLFVQNEQNAEGGYDVLVSADAFFTKAQAFRCVFETAIVARILGLFVEEKGVAKTLDSCCTFLYTEREASGLWKYFGKGSVIAPDVDDTACCMLVLPPNGSDAEILAQILANCNPEGCILTWLLSREDEPPYRNSLDPAVNANVFMLLCQRNIESPAVLKFLVDYLNSPQSGEGTSYYYSPFYFLYALSKVKINLSENVVASIEQRVLDLCKSRTHLGILEISQACVTLAALGSSPNLRIPLVKRILAAQQLDGGWPAEPLALGLNRVRYFYGSRAVTSAFCLEALTSVQEYIFESY